ncbi:MAG: hypothetical protein CVV35_07460 [Methanomicrobiales archaeon HGW-Methanomicrobiales-6]|nr:MAG: hypothetical protein CVV35_07460 [Methanomicrobiales archaeon HGW-Methanomicrobiales-6]
MRGEREEGRLRFHPHPERWGLPAPPPSPPQVKNIRHVYVKECTAKVEGDRIVEYRANVNVTFIVERES